MLLHCLHCGSAATHSRQHVYGQWVICPVCFQYYPWREAKPYDPINALAKAVERIPLGVTVTDTEGRIVYINRADAQMHGYEVNEVLGKNVAVFAMPEERRPLTSEKLATMTSWKRESRNVRKDGSVFSVELHCDVIRSPDGRPIAVVTTCQDISERKRLETALHSTAAS